MTALTIFALYPELTSRNGDVGNADILVQRCRWAGHSAESRQISLGDDLPSFSPDIVILGSAPDSQVMALSELLEGVKTRLLEWVREGVGFLAVGTGMDVLCETFDVDGKRQRDGLGIFPGAATWQDKRVSSHLVVDSGSDVYVGFENHRRAFVTDSSERNLGRVIHGDGNGHSSGVEGIFAENALGTHLHGPVFAKNPVIADRFLATAFERQGMPGVSFMSEQSARVDAIARQANEATMKRLRVTKV